jgi:superfamily II DNA or RNA helicase
VIQPANTCYTEMMPSIDALFQSVREAAPSALWSLGVQIARRGGVVCEKRTDKEIVLRVTTQGKTVSSTVQLWPEDEDWHCDCGRSLAACEHVTASVISLRQAGGTNPEKPASHATTARLYYHFEKQASTLIVRRELIVGEKRVPVERTIYSAARQAGVDFSPSKADATVENLIAETPGKVLPSARLGQVLRLLQGSTTATLESREIEIGRPISPFRVVVEDSPDGGVRVLFEKTEGVGEVFSNGAALFETQLCATNDPEFTAQEAELWRGRVFAPAQFTDLASRILPALKRKIKVNMITRRIPTEFSDDLPRVIVHTSGSREVLSILPLIVYGDPPYARVDGANLTLLGESGRVPERDLSLERRLIANFNTQIGLSMGRRADFVAERAVAMAQKLESLNFNVVGDSLAAFRRKAALEAELSVGSETFEIRFRTGTGEASADPNRVFRAWQEGMERVPLLDGGWAPIPKAWLDAHGHTILDLLDLRDRKGRLPVFARPELARLCEALNTPYPADLSTLRNTVEGFEKIPTAKLPKDLNAELRSYQKHGVDWLQFLKTQGLGALLADDMGLGKTLQALCVLEGKSLIVAPTSVLPNWKNEINRFRPKVKVAIYHGSERELDQDAEVTLTSYALLRRDIKSLATVNWDAVVLDEAQNIKNPESQSAQSAFELKAAFRVALTGTPVENRVEDLWSLFHFLNPGLLGGRRGFSKRLDTLHLKIKPFVLRRLKKEVAPELPARTELVLNCDLDENERTLYTSVLAATRKEVVEQLQAGSVLAALEALLRLRQAACHPSLLPGKTAPDSSKLRLLREKLQESVDEGHKALVFSQWTGFLDLVEPGLKADGIAYLRLDGSTPADTRAQIVSTFQGQGGPPVLLMTLKSGGVGLNLTAADHVFLLDPWWNPAAEDQAADRAHRIGQDRPVFIHRLVARDTVEEKILALQESKRKAAANALSGATSTSLTKDDLLALLS